MKNVLLGALSYGYPMGMLWLSYGNKSQLPYNTLYSLLIYDARFTIFLVSLVQLV